MYVCVYMYLCIYIYVHIYSYMYIYMRVCIYVYICILIYVRAHMYTVCVYMYVFIFICMWHVYIHIYIFISIHLYMYISCKQLCMLYMYMYKHMNIYMRIHIHIHAHRVFSSWTQGLSFKKKNRKYIQNLCPFFQTLKFSDANLVKRYHLVVLFNKDRNYFIWIRFICKDSKVWLFLKKTWCILKLRTSVRIFWHVYHVQVWISCKVMTWCLTMGWLRSVGSLKL